MSERAELEYKKISRPGHPHAKGMPSAARRLAASLLGLPVAYNPGLLCMMPPSAKMVVAVI